MILLDTNVIIEILEKRSKVGEKLYSSLVLANETIGTTAINLHEILFGLKKYSKQIKELIRLPTIGYTKDDAELSSNIELNMEKAGLAIRRADAMIAAVAINHSMKLLTLDEKHFGPLAAKTSLELFSA